MAQLKKSERRCWLVTAHAPAGTTMRQANDAWNEFVADRTRGALLFHDHFGDTPGGVAVFAPDTPEELRAIRTKGPVEGWDVHCHPLIFAEGRLGFLFQVDFTMIAYRGERLPDLYEEYAASEGGQKNAAREI